MYVEVHTLEDLRAQLQTNSLDRVVVQGLDLRALSTPLRAVSAAGSAFLGCTLDPLTCAHVQQTGGIVFPRLEGLPYQPFRPALYTVGELMDGYRRGVPESFSTDTLDSRIYRHFQTNRAACGPDSIMEALAQRLHDHAIDDAINDLLCDGQRQVAGVMGGHAMTRDDPRFRDVARIARQLAQAGLFVATGGGPGAMEAANLGAWMSGRSLAQLDAAIDHLATTPAYTDPGWLDTALDILERFPDGGESLAVPTWFYGHEPSNLFSVHVAKYFANSIREDGLLAIATRGVIYAPGSAGTIQEIFMDATQNHYGTFEVISPMVFLGRDYWTREKPVYPLLMQLAEGRAYRDLIAISDDTEEITSFILDNPPQPFKG
ncbi:MAG: putative Rossmann-fold nucleotide-binding protein [Myxococcota bacterium]|jgi:predicted Rossmann-fold nucleotide-binding protein